MRTTRGGVPAGRGGGRGGVAVGVGVVPTHASCAWLSPVQSVLFCSVGQTQKNRSCQLLKHCSETHQDQTTSTVSTCRENRSRITAQLIDVLAACVVLLRLENATASSTNEKVANFLIGCWNRKAGKLNALCKSEKRRHWTTAGHVRSRGGVMRVVPMGV